MRISISLFVAIFTVLLAGCSLSVPSKVSMDRIQVEERYVHQSYAREHMNEAVIKRVAADYKRHATGDLNVHIAYPADMKDAEAEATRIARQYGAQLSEMGVQNMTVAVVPTYARDKERQVIFSYPRHKARAPNSCGRLPGQDGGEGVYDIRDYDVGCENMRYLSKMIADPTDLLGKDTLDAADSRRSGIVVERYSSGEELDALDITSSSGGLGN